MNLKIFIHILKCVVCLQNQNYTILNVKFRNKYNLYLFYYIMKRHI